MSHAHASEKQRAKLVCRQKGARHTMHGMPPANGNAVRDAVQACWCVCGQNAASTNGPP